MAELFSRLLLATEHTEFDTGAETVAMDLAQRCQLPLATVLPLVSNPEYEALAPQLAARAEHDAATKIAQLRAQADAVGVTIALRVRRGEEPYCEIVQEAREQGSDLIIIRRRGKRSFLANLLVGEMVSKVVAHAPCHVLIVPREGCMWRRRVLAAVEPTAQGRQVVATAAAVAAECGLPLHLVCVVASEEERQPAQAFINGMQDQARPAGVAAQGEVRTGKPFTEILASVTSSGSDLIVMGSRGDSRIGRALVGGVAQKVMGLSEHPVLVLHFK
ncbi:MAG: universal stress protein [Polaromonas sp.]|uniref:universal stress protein n=1 Tax=Polaromonas sp. TaxID=1869339 RepID=UPI00271FB51B|nr:universal stress protein [Polaromonas sp.]MDO9112582.1 universal stress protein [Polaromonas sp.]MDP1887223.1 universal stress protein [Polaromonas sp.]